MIDSRGRRTAVGVPIPGAALSVRSGLARDVQVIASEPASEVSGRQRGVWLLVGLLAVGGTAAAVGLAVVQGRRLARPLERLSRTSTLLGTGDFSARASRSGIPEMDAVAEALDTTAVRIARLLGRERDLSADVSHQLRTPLTALRLRLEELSQLRDPESINAEAAGALAEADRPELMIGDLLAAARRGRSDQVGTLELSELAHRHAHRWRASYARAHRPLRVAPSRPLRAHGSAGAVGQALDVLLENALRHGAGGVTLDVAQRDGLRCRSGPARKSFDV